MILVFGALVEEEDFSSVNNKSVDTTTHTCTVSKEIFCFSVNINLKDSFQSRIDDDDDDDDDDFVFGLELKKRMNPYCDT
jgi:hypothetical protein